MKSFSIFGFKKSKSAKTAEKSYDRDNLEPIVRCSICTGEQVAGFKNIRSGKFEEVMLIRDQSDLDIFKRMYGILDMKKEY